MADERPAKLRKLSHEAVASVTHQSGKGDADASQEFRDSETPEFVVDEAAGSDDESSGRGAEISTTADKDGSPKPEAEQATNGSTKPMSKNRLKKLRKRQEWEAGREDRKAKRKEKAKEKKVRKRAAWEEAKASGQVEIKGQPRRPPEPVRLPITFIIDCAFDDLMAEKERISLGSQLTRSYSDNSRAPYQAHLVVSSWGGQLKQRFDTVLNGHYHKWKGISFTDEDFVAAAQKATVAMSEPKSNKLEGVFAKYADPSIPKAGKRRQPAEEVGKELSGETESIDQPPFEPLASPTNNEQQQPATTATTTQSRTHPPLPDPETIYLTSDSPYTLTELTPHSTYIIGGLVDKNRHKGICYKMAQERGLRTAKLPISEFMEMQSRSVLATNHVNEIMLRWLECGDWGEAFVKVIPKRKGGKLRGAGADGEVRGDGEGGDGDDDDDDHDDGKADAAAA
jgi:tRNA (guanine9-N1)-methyltransferase